MILCNLFKAQSRKIVEGVTIETYMSDKMYDELPLERAIRDNFGIDVDMRQVIVMKVPVSHTTEATLFLTTKKQLFLYIIGKSKLSLGDIKKLVVRMGLKAELYLPPKGRPFYFDEIGRNKFHEVFPGRKHISDSDIIFYRTLAPYNPALVLISEVKDGHIYQFDSDATTNWRIAAKFAYRRIKTS
jgi:hypothetical protein